MMDIEEWFWKYKDKIIGCLNQNDANWVYDSDESIEDLKKILGDKYD